MTPAKTVLLLLLPITSALPLPKLTVEAASPASEPICKDAGDALNCPLVSETAAFGLMLPVDAMTSWALFTLNASDWEAAPKMSNTPPLTLVGPA